MKNLFLFLTLLPFTFFSQNELEISFGNLADKSNYEFTKFIGQDHNGFYVERLEYKIMKTNLGTVFMPMLYYDKYDKSTLAFLYKIDLNQEDDLDKIVDLRSRKIYYPLLASNHFYLFTQNYDPLKKTNVLSFQEINTTTGRINNPKVLDTYNLEMDKSHFMDYVMTLSPDSTKLIITTIESEIKGENKKLYENKYRISCFETRNMNLVYSKTLNSDYDGEKLKLATKYTPTTRKAGYSFEGSEVFQKMIFVNNAGDTYMGFEDNSNITLGCIRHQNENIDFLNIRFPSHSISNWNAIQSDDAHILISGVKEDVGEYDVFLKNIDANNLKVESEGTIGMDSAFASAVETLQNLKKNTQIAPVKFQVNNILKIQDYTYVVAEISQLVEYYSINGVSPNGNVSMASNTAKTTDRRRELVVLVFDKDLKLTGRALLPKCTVNGGIGYSCFVINDLLRVMFLEDKKTTAIIDGKKKKELNEVNKIRGSHVVCYTVNPAGQIYRQLLFTNDAPDEVCIEPSLGISGVFPGFLTELDGRGHVKFALIKEKK
ncbi:MAG: hypothetical protein JST26_01260 [Bacteroidetes bacterium]|nr:hypothetical protein [Bacteroidota bacterium]